MLTALTSASVRRSSARARLLRVCRLLGLLAAALACLHAGPPARAHQPLGSPPAGLDSQTRPGPTATSQPQTTSFEYVGGLSGGLVTTVAVSDTLAYVGQGAQLTILDISTTLSGVPVATLPLTTTLTDIQVLGPRAYAIDAERDLLIFDIGDPARPTVLGRYDTPGTAEQVLVSGNRAYLAAGASGLLILDVSDSAHPVLLGSYAAPSRIVDVDVAGDRAYVVDHDMGLLILDISVPAAPVKLGAYNPLSFAWRVRVVGSRAYLIEGQGLIILDIGDPARVIKLGTYSAVPTDALRVVGTRVYASDLYSLMILDAGNPDSPTELSRSFQFGGPLDFDVAGDRAYLAVGAEGLRVVDVSQPAAPVLVDSYHTVSALSGVGVSGDHAYLLDATGLLIADVGTPGRPAVVGEYDVEGQDIKLVGDVAYVAGLGAVNNSRVDFLILDLGDPAAPELRGGYAIEPSFSTAHAVDVVGTRAYIVNGDWRFAGLRILDIADPSAPELRSYTQQAFAGNVQVIGNRAYVGFHQGFGADGGLSIYDVSDPVAPALLGTYPITDSVTGLQIVDDRAYLTTGTSGLQILDVSDPAAPALLGSYITSDGLNDVQVVGAIAYVAAGERGVYALDVRDPAHPAPLASYDTPGNARRLQVVGDLVYVADGPAGLQILRLDLKQRRLFLSIALR